MRYDLMLAADFGSPFGISFILRSGERVAGQFTVFFTEGLNDVITVVRVDRFADLTRFESESGIFEFLNHLTAGEPAKGAAVVFVGGVKGIRGSQLFPISTVIQLRNEFLCLFFGLDQNVVGIDHFGFKHTVCDSLVEQCLLKQDVLGIVVQEIIGQGAVIAHCGNIFNIGFKLGIAVGIVIQIADIEVIRLKSERAVGAIIDRIFITEHFLQCCDDRRVIELNAVFFGFGFENLIVNKLVNDFFREGLFPVFTEL